MKKKSMHKEETEKRKKENSKNFWEELITYIVAAVRVHIGTQTDWRVL
jgi:hypothetical protein